MTHDHLETAPAVAATASAETTPELRELARVCEKRAATYGLLARLFAREVDEAFLNEMHAMRFPASTGNAVLDQGYRLMATYLSGVWTNSAAEPAVDFTNLFLGHGVDAYSAAYPFESVYTSERRLLMQEARGEVLAIYRSQGLAKSDEWGENEDHVAVELEFMQALCQRCAAVLDAGDEARVVALLETQKNFLDDHLASWVPMMTADMRHFAKTDLYRGLAYMTDGFLATEVEFLGEILVDEGADAGTEGAADGR